MNASVTVISAARTARSFASALAWLCVVAAAEPTVLFRAPFHVEHHLVQTAADGEEMHTDSVTDTYTGSWIVSARANGDRTIIDLARREITEVQSAKGTFWSLSFSRMAELRGRLRRAERPAEATGIGRAAEPRTNADGKPAIRVEDVSDRAAAGDSPRAARGAGRFERPGVRHLRASAEGGSASVDVWVDPSLRLSREARAAIASFETDALGAPASGADVPHAELVAAARDAADGAFVVRSRRRAGKSGGEVEDIVTRIEPAGSVSPKLLTIPPSFRRVPSPLEAMVSFAEEEASRSSAALSRPAN